MNCAAVAKNVFSISGKRLRVQRFPLDHTQKPRLVNMRLVLKKNCTRIDLLTILGWRRSPLIRERISRQKAMMHWFMRGQDYYEHQVLIGEGAIRGSIVRNMASSRADSPDFIQLSA